MTSCASIYTQIAGHSDSEDICGDQGVSQIYSGTQFDFEGLGYDNAAFFCLIDLPMSMIIDTVILPYTVLSRVTDFGYCSKSLE